MSGVNVDFYKAQLLKQADQLDQRLLTNGMPASRHIDSCGLHPAPLRLQMTRCGVLILRSVFYAAAVQTM